MTSTSVEEMLLQKQPGASRIEEVIDEEEEPGSSASEVEESSESECDHDHHDGHHHHHHHRHHHEHVDEPQQAIMRNVNRSEKKARKALAKVGLKPMPQVKRVTLRRGKSIFAIDLPEVFSTSDAVTGESSFIVFGDLRAQNSDLTRMLAEQFASTQDINIADGYDEIAAKMMAEQVTTGTTTTISENQPKKQVDVDENERIEEQKGGPKEPLPEGVDEKDVSIVMSQAGVSRQRAIEELVKQNGDIVNAIMELTM